MTRRPMLAITAALLLAGIAAPAAAQSPEAQRLLERAGAVYEMANRAGLQGEPRMEITGTREALALIDQAAALMTTPDPQVTFVRREMMLSLGQAHGRAGQWQEALAVYSRVTDEIAAAGAPIPGSRQHRLHLARALRGEVDAAVALGDFAAARASLGRLIETGRLMLAAEPANSYLIRQLARDLTGEALFRWVLEGAGAGAELALEAVALFRPLAEANPQNVEAGRAYFIWAYAAAVLTGDDDALWREAAQAGNALDRLGGVPDDQRGFLRNAREEAGRRGG